MTIRGLDITHKLITGVYGFPTGYLLVSDGLSKQGFRNPSGDLWFLWVVYGFLMGYLWVLREFTCQPTFSEGWVANAPKRRRLPNIIPEKTGFFGE